MDNLLQNQLLSLKEKCTKFNETHKERIQRIIDDIQKLVTEEDNIKVNWVGTWFNDSYNFYSDFVNNSGKHFKVDYQQLETHLQTKTGIKLDSLDAEVKKIQLECKELNRSIITELSILKDDPKFASQLSILKSLEEFEWGYSPSTFVEIVRPKQFMGNYLDAQKIMNEGYNTPPHILLGAETLSIMSEVTAIEEHQKLLARLLREIELKIATSSRNQEYMADDNLTRLLDRFHDVAKQLVNRHSGRNTLLIDDEYDVQDLLHALLKIYFDDIRPEEFTPSYAGRNTRVDFLLKNERILVEIKKPRSNQKDKDIGDELLQDIARYKNHPDCDTLYCFVYDPNGLIANPRGLEKDLMSESSEKLKVIVFIRP